MIYFTTTEDQAVLIIEPGNIIALKTGDVLVTPDKKIMIAYTPDLLFFRDELVKKIAFSSTFDVKEFDRIHAESMKRSEVVEREYHNYKRYDFKNDFKK